MLQIVGQPDVIVVDDFSGCDINYSRNCRSAFIIRICFGIQLTQELHTQHRIGLVLIVDKLPAQILFMLAVSRQINADSFLQPEQLSHNSSTV
ncbi:hypothetical protein D3C73_995360 [compost metagenome]